MNTERYSSPAIAAHWLIALLIFAAFPLGLYMHELPLSPTKLKLYSYHKWIGMTVLGLFVLRVLWRLTHRPPAPLPAPAGPPARQRQQHMRPGQFFRHPGHRGDPIDCR